MSFAVKSYRKEVEGALADRKRDALNATGITIAGAAKEKTPVQDGVLRASISWAIDGGGPQYPPGEIVETNSAHPEGSKAVNQGVKAPRDTVIIGTNVVYARYQHETLSLNHTKPIIKGPNKGGIVQQGEAKFLEKAARENRAKVERDIERALKGELERMV